MEPTLRRAAHRVKRECRVLRQQTSEPTPAIPATAGIQCLNSSTPEATGSQLRQRIPESPKAATDVEYRRRCYLPELAAGAGSPVAAGDHTNVATLLAGMSYSKRSEPCFTDRRLTCVLPLTATSTTEPSPGFWKATSC